MEFRQLECFVAVAESLHFGRAAERLCMTQPPLSRQIQLLEQALGVTLFERNSRQVELTAAGRHFLRDARHLLEYSARAAATARRASGGEAGHITLGFTAVASYRLMPAMIMQARKVLADVEIQLRETVSTDLNRLLLKEVSPVRLVFEGKLKSSGNPLLLAKLFGMLDDFDFWFDIVTPPQKG